MKKYVSGVVLGVFLLSGSSALAQESPSSSVKASVEVKKEELRAKKEEKKEARVDKKKERLQQFWNSMKHRLQALLKNQNRLADRIEAKLKKLKENGRDVAAQEAKLATARVAIKAAEDALKAADAAVADAIKNNEPDVALKKIREINKGVLEKVKAAHDALVDVMSGTKPGKLPKPSGSVSPSPSPSTT